MGAAVVGRRGIGEDMESTGELRTIVEIASKAIAVKSAETVNGTETGTESGTEIGTDTGTSVIAEAGQSALTMAIEIVVPIMRINRVLRSKVILEATSALT